MKRIIRLVILLMVVMTASCATPDPGDLSDLDGLLRRLTPEQTLRLNREAQRAHAIRALAKSTGRDVNKPDAFKGFGHVATIWCDSDQRTMFGTRVGPEDLLSAILSQQFDGTVDSVWKYLFELVGVARHDTDTNVRNCKQSYSTNNGAKVDVVFDVEDAVVEAKAGSDKASKFAVEYLIVGAIAGVAIAVIAPELLPILCSLDVSAYCGDTPSEWPTLPPVPFNQPDPDAP